MQKPLVVCVMSLLAVGPMVLAVRPAEEASTAAAAKVVNRFLAGLDAAQRQKAQFEFADKERTNWQFVPGIYPGVTLRDLDVKQRRAAHRVLNAMLSGSGYSKVTAIMKLEDTLREMAEANGRKAPHRDPERYSLAVFGKPGGKAPWGVRFQGHHLSLNLTSTRGKLTAMTPMFLGANPAEIRKGAHAGFRALADEEDYARELMASFTDEQMQSVMLSDKAPSDVLWGPGKRRDVLKEPHGLSSKEMTWNQFSTLAKLITVHQMSFKPKWHLAEKGIFNHKKSDLRFGWMGSTKPGQGHYYRIVGEGFAIEYDNTQNGANHVHVVWHDLTNDFGADWLKQHYKQEHGK